MYKHFIAIFLCGLTTTSWASNTCFSRMSDGVGMPTAVSSFKSHLALLSRKGNVWSSVLDTQRRRRGTLTQMMTGEGMGANNQQLQAAYRQTQMMTGERKMTNGLSVQAAGATSLHPFVPTTIVGGDFAEGTRWYTLKFKNTTLAVAAADGSISEVPATAGNVDRTMPQQPDNQLWCFVGNEQEGYTLYNKPSVRRKHLSLWPLQRIRLRQRWSRWRVIRSVLSGGSRHHPTSLQPSPTLFICNCEMPMDTP